VRKITQKKALEALEQKEEKLLTEWKYFIQREIYYQMTPHGYRKKRPGKKDFFYKPNQIYVAWITYPTGNFEYLGEVICVESWWNEYVDSSGYQPWGRFKTKDGKEIEFIRHFITTKQIKETIEKAIKTINKEGKE